MDASEFYGDDGEDVFDPPQDGNWRPVQQLFAGNLQSGSMMPAVFTAMTFDPHQELLWTGDENGRVASFFSGSLQRYTSFIAHKETGASVAGVGGIRQLIVNDLGVISLDRTSLRLTSRRGVVGWNSLEPEYMDLKVMTTMRGDQDILVGGHQRRILVVNLNRGTITRRLDDEARISFLKTNDQYYVCGTLTGDLHLRDPKTLKIQHRIPAHTGGILDMDVSENLIWSSGYSLRQGQLVMDPVVKGFDIRMMKSTVSCSFQQGPSFIRAHPNSSSTCFISSQQGEIQMVDFKDESHSQFFQTGVPFVTSLALAPSGECLAICDQSAIVHLWAISDSFAFNSYSHLPEMPRSAVPTDVVIDETTPFSHIGMPYYDTPLLSATFNPDSTYILGRQPPKIDPDILASMKVVDFVGYATNPRRTRRYQVDTKSQHSKNKRMEPKFRSEKDRERRYKNNEIESPTNFEDALQNDSEHAYMSKIPPEYYKKIEIKYSKFGVEDFDFAFYNKTHFGGLETHIANSYCNSILQAFHFTKPLRSIAKSHIASVDCQKEHCLCCELGFLFRMLEDANGQNCQASNFLRAFSTIPQAAALGLFDHEENNDRNVSYTSLIQNFNRFLVEHINNESNLKDTNPSFVTNNSEEDSNGNSSPSPLVSQVLGAHVSVSNMCNVCGDQTKRTTSPTVHDIVYPRTSPDPTNPTTPFTREPTFEDILRTTLIRIPETTRAWCSKCNAYQIIRTERHLLAPFPPVLALNAAIRTPEQGKIWVAKERKSGVYEQFLKDRFSLITSNDGSIVDQIRISGEDGIWYRLTALIVQIENEKEKPHLVSYVRIPKEELDRDDPLEWYLFNDFLVKGVTMEEVLAIPSWKSPSVLIFQREDSDRILNYDILLSKIDKSILTKQVSIARNKNKNKLSFEALDQSELPTPGTLVAIDAEFVAMQQEEIEIRSDGTRSVVRPTRLSLARVSVLRGDGPKSGVPFIDDYIATFEPVYDYLTEYSGIQPGDLDPVTSKHTLVPLKHAYKKLRVLIDLGCIFVGHGLDQDFRIINILIPRDQVIDTVAIYRIAQRKLSLRFLSWIVLGEDIQIETHDSIEDAKMALFIYKKYLEYETENRFDEVLEDIYSEGRKCNFKPPSAIVAATTSDSVNASPDPSTNRSGASLMVKGVMKNSIGRAQTPPWERASTRSNFRGMSPKPEGHAK